LSQAAPVRPPASSNCSAASYSWAEKRELVTGPNPAHGVETMRGEAKEACALRWSEIDFTGSCLRLEATKTGRSTRPIAKAARDLLQSLPRLSDEWVFPNRTATGRAELKASIAELFDAAELKDARSHDPAARSGRSPPTKATATRRLASCLAISAAA